MAGHEDVWYASNGEIREYVQAYRRLVFSVDGKTVYNPSAVCVSLGGTFTKEYIEVPAGQTAKLIPPVEM